MMKFRNKLVLYVLRKIRLSEHQEYIYSTIENIKDGVDISGPNLWVLAAAIFIASLGLNTNSTAVIIGAMLVSPIMGPIMGLGLGLGIGDMTLVYKSFRNYVVAAVISILVSSVYFFISPVKEAGSELLSRTAPTIYDVLIALFGGLAGIIAGSSKLSKSNVIPGVAIATALMPPLCTVGYGIANWQGNYVIGALYLFFINSVFISLATYLIVRLLKYPHVHIEETRRTKRIQTTIWIIVTLTIIPSFYLTYQIVRKYVFERSASEFVRKEISNDPHHFLISRKFDFDDGSSQIQLTMLGEEIDSIYTTFLKSKMKKYGLGRAKLKLIRAGETKVAEGFYNQINSNLQVNTGSIQDLYSRMDSLQKQFTNNTLKDTLNLSLASEAKSQLAELSKFSVTPSVVFDFEKQAKDTLWIATASFNPWPSTVKIKNFRAWLANRLQTDHVRLIID